MDFLVHLLLCYLPPRWRRRWGQAESPQLGRAALLTGLLQAAAALLVYAAGFIGYLPESWMPRLAWMEYMFSPTALVLAYLILEGVVRGLVGLVTGEAIGLFLLYPFAWAHTALTGWKVERALGPLIADKVERGDGKAFDLRIASCRPKPDWDRLMTIVIEEVFYEVAGQEEGRPPRRFVYLLRKMPEHKVVRGLHHYDPNEPLRKP
ncbi:MAG: hypothetical protein ACRD4D_06525 [Candidatus Acidiferrales bacterium]